MRSSTGNALGEGGREVRIPERLGLDGLGEFLGRQCSAAAVVLAAAVAASRVTP
ncbi:MAG: hypothetical protein WBW80_14050 [Acidimicrobiales bacterium]